MNSRGRAGLAPGGWPADILLALGAWTLGALIFFRHVIWSGFDQIVGDQGDTRLVVAIHEHWLRVFRGDASWRAPGYFHPSGGVLGYTDTFLLNMPLYAPLRALGSDPWLALQLTLMALTLVGYLATYFVLRLLVGADRLVAGALAATFTFGNNMAVSADHPQLVLVNWLPVIVLLTWGSTRSQATGRSAALGGAAGMLFGLVTYSAFYVGWLAALAMLVFLLVLGTLRTVSGALPQALSRLRTHARTPISFLIGAGVPLVPFLLTYVPVLGDSTPRTYAEVMAYAPRPGDLLNVGPGNRLWGSTIRRLLGDDAVMLSSTEVALTVTPVLLSLVLVSGVAFALRRRREGARSGTDAALAAAITVVILAVLPIEWGAGSLWAVVWQLVPGSVAIRSTGRLQLVTSFLATITVTSGITYGMRSFARGTSARKVASLVLTLVLALVLAEQYSVRDFTRIDRSGEERAAARISSPPPSCRSFFMAPEEGRPAFAVGTDAMLIAVRSGVPTVNGYSGTTPENYTIDPTSRHYVRQVEIWAEAHGIEESICAVDRLRGTWDVDPFDG